MKIGFDGKRAAQNFTGLGNYSRYALEALLEYYPGEEYNVYIPKDVGNPKFEQILSNSAGKMRKCLPLSKKAAKFKALWRVWGVTKTLVADNVQVFHGLSNELPLNISKASSTVKSVVTVHDVIFRRLPGCYPVIDRMIYDYKFRRACRNADHVIAVSECTKRDIVNDYGISPDKVSVIYQGCDPLFAEPINKERMAEIKAKYSLPDKFIVSVGTIEERKNLLSVVKSLLLLPDDVHLVAVGRRTKYTALVDKFVAENHLQHRVHLLHGVPYIDLPVIYRCADVFAYMSLYEGFGIPLLEALNSRVPVVAATGSCLEEAGGPGSIYVEPFDVEAIAGAVKRCLLPDVREAMVAAGLEWAARFSMERFAHETMDCYKMLTGEK
jgi:glycosyltransferase involved in cell wall biosynthesis